MSVLEKMVRGASLYARDAASVAKVMIRSRAAARRRPADRQREIFILGNGPSLRQTIDTAGALLAEKDLMAVNFFANTPDFQFLRPAHYILADGHFFDGIATDSNVKRLWQHLADVKWSMTLHVPATRVAMARKLFGGSIATFNLTPVEGHKTVTHALMSRGLGMPRPRNVMIPAIMVSLLDGYGRIFLLGADHSWSRTLSVDDRNRVLSRQPHFYEDNEKELDRVAAEYAGYHLHDILNSLTVAFRSYHCIAAYADSIGADIINLTPGSMIDAFPRERLENILHG